MSFVSPEFAFAALLFFPLFWSLRGSRRNQLFLLTASSYLLYASWSAVGTAMLLAYSLGIWWLGNRVNVSSGLRTLRLAVSLVLGLSFLLVTKYYEFLRQGVSDILPGLGLQSLLPVLDFVAPVGVSFFTFQAVTYLVWRHQSPRERVPPLRVLAFLSFWPTLFAGPILRAADFFRQIRGEDFGAPKETSRALYLILLGLAQKLVFANWLAESFVDGAFRYPDGLDALSSAAAIWAYTLQIFLDFSGYSLIVTGLALLLGYSVPENFRQPYLARSLREFWRGWHITLSSFIRDYIYIPLGGSKAGVLRTQANIMIAMLVSGLWHGASTTFLVWGALHGIGMLLLNAADRIFPQRMGVVFGRIVTLVFVAFAWVFFRAATWDEAWKVLQALTIAPQAVDARYLGLFCFSVLFFFLSTRAAQIETRVSGFLAQAKVWALAATLSLLSFSIIHFGPSGVPGFIYYRF